MKNILILISIFFITKGFSQEYTTLYGTKSEIYTAGLVNQFEKAAKGFSEAIKQQAELNEKIVNSRTNFWNSIKNKSYNKELLAEYQNYLYQKDMHFFLKETTSIFGANRDYIDSFYGVIGLGRELDDGINAYAENEFYNWILSIKKSFINEQNTTLPSIFTENFTKNFNKIFIKHQDLYLNYLSKRNIGEYLLKNPKSPLLSTESVTYLEGIYFLFEKCDNLANCSRLVDKLKKSVDKETFSLIVNRIRKSHPKIINEYQFDTGNAYDNEWTFNNIENTISETIKIAQKAKDKGKKVSNDLLMNYVNEFYLDKRRYVDYIQHSRLFEYKVEIVNLKWTPYDSSNVKPNSNGRYEFELSEPLYKNIPSLKLKKSGTNPDYHTTDQKIRDLIAGKISSIKATLTMREDDIDEEKYSVSLIAWYWQF